MSDSMNKHISKDAVQRIELFTGTGRRRQWSRAEKLRIVSESYAPGTTASAVARRNAMSAAQLFAWRRELREEALAARDMVPRFVPIAVDAAAAAGAACDGGTITIEVNGAVVRVPGGADAATLRAVVQALRSP